MFGFSSSKSSSEATDARSQSSGFQTLAAGGNQGALSYYNPDAPVFNFGGGNSSPWKVAVLILIISLMLNIKSFRRMFMKLFKGKK